MKRLFSIIIIAFIALASMDATAQSSKAEDSTIPFEELVNMIVTSAHWSENNLSEMGLTKIGSMSYEEEFGECSIFAYGKNVKGNISEDWQVELSADGAHAYAIVVQLTTDNGTSLYFKEKEDHDAFMSCIRQSSVYRQDEYDEMIGDTLIEHDEYLNGWYVIQFHVG